MDSDQRDRRDPHDEDAGATAADSSAEVEDNAGEASTEPIEPGSAGAGIGPGATPVDGRARPGSG